MYQDSRSQSPPRIILGIDPGLAHTGWGIISQHKSSLRCVAYGCIETKASDDLPFRLKKIHDQLKLIIDKFRPSHVGIETVWFGKNVSAAFATGQARGAALVACAFYNLDIMEFAPREIKLAVVGEGSAEKEQVQYMVSHLLKLDHIPKPDHAADALACALCCTTFKKMNAYLYD